MSGIATLLHPARIVVACLVALTGISTTALARDTRASDAISAPELTPMSATYGATMDKGLAINGEATRTLHQQSNGTWIYHFNVESFIADIEESVTFEWKEGRIRPLNYRYNLKGLLVADRSRAMNFNHADSKVNGSFEGDSFSMAMPENALDPLGFQLQLRQDLKAGKQDITYTVADDGDYDHDRFAVIGDETLNTPKGEIVAIKVEKVRNEDSKRQTLMWFAPALDYLLIKLVQVEPDGSRYEVNLRDADISAP